MDLGALKYVNYANIYFRANWRPHDYRIQYATTAEGLDGDYYDLTAETLQSSSSNANQLMPETLGINRHIRWLKILCYRSASAAPGNVSIHEVELFGRGAPEPAEILISETPRYYAGGGYDTTAITVTQAGKHAFFQNGEALFDMAAGYVESKATVINNKTEAGNQNLWYVFAAYGGDGNALTDIKLVPCSLRPGETKELSAGLNVSSSSGAMKAFVLEEGTLAPLLEKISLP
jgi:hypothetical protein